MAHDGETDDDILDVQANADHIRASILSGKPMDEGQEFATPGECGECIIQQGFATGKI